MSAQNLAPVFERLSTRRDYWFHWIKFFGLTSDILGPGEHPTFPARLAPPLEAFSSVTP